LKNQFEPVALMFAAEFDDPAGAQNDDGYLFPWQHPPQPTRILR
jgi:hypothetical protein